MLNPLVTVPRCVRDFVREPNGEHEQAVILAQFLDGVRSAFQSLALGVRFECDDERGGDRGGRVC